MGPIADFACLAKPCRQEDGSAAVYELPIKATRCPMCGSKRIQRLWDKAPGLLRSGAREMHHLTDVAVAQSMEDQHDRQASAQRIAAEQNKVWQCGNVRLIPVATRNVGNAVAAESGVQVTLPAGASKAVAAAPASWNEAQSVRGAKPVPGADSRRDRSKVTVQRTGAGSGVVQAALG